MKTEPNKLEIQFKEQLNAREIQPSEMAWDRLDAMLSLAEEKNSKKSSFLSYRNIGIAASILVLVSLGLFFFNQRGIVVNPEYNVVVKENSKVNSINNNKFKNSDFSNANENSNNNELENREPVADTPIQKPEPVADPIINQNKEMEFQSAEVIAQSQLPNVQPPQEKKGSNLIKVNAVDLLASVDKPTKLNISPKIKVNANSLLSQVDGELDQTFREKVFTRVTKNYKEIKIALKTRNQE
jgi:hypothetical protein